MPSPRSREVRAVTAIPLRTAVERPERLALAAAYGFGGGTQEYRYIKNLLKAA